MSLFGPSGKGQEPVSPVQTGGLSTPAPGTPGWRELPALDIANRTELTALLAPAVAATGPAADR